MTPQNTLYTFEPLNLYAFAPFYLFPYIRQKKTSINLKAYLPTIVQSADNQNYL